jgi:hypothetical protein
MRRSTVVILLLFLVMAGAYYYVNNRAKPADITVTLEPTTEVSYLFEPEAGQATEIRIESKQGEVVELARNAENAWALKLPIEASAEQGSAEAAASQVTTIRISDRLSATVSPKDVGLDAPEYRLTVMFADGVERKASIGVVTPTESGYYAQLDGEAQIVIVSKASIDSLISLLTNPPYAETLTPSPVPPTATETPPLPTPGLATPVGETFTPTP